MRVIAEELGMTQGSLYYYFRNKQEILYFCQASSLDSMLESGMSGPSPEFNRVVNERKDLVAYLERVRRATGG